MGLILVVKGRSNKSTVVDDKCPDGRRGEREGEGELSCIPNFYSFGVEYED
jgi:hypothetical protein